MQIALPMICPICPIDTLRGTASVEAAVFRRLAVSQLSNGGMLAKENDTAMQRIPYRALKEVGGNAPRLKGKTARNVEQIGPTHPVQGNICLR